LRRSRVGKEAQFLKGDFMKKATIIGLAMAGLAWWLGNRACAKVKDMVSGTAPGKAHTPGGDDASASFNAGIADENTIPDAMPAI
jgi:hypothetical protein